MRLIPLLVLAMTLPALRPATATAAEIALAPAGASCAITLAGRIEAGDAARLEAAIAEAKTRVPPFLSASPDTQQRRRICLDSPGGALAEGVAIAELLRRQVFGTLVPRGASCLSACAVAFMGGTAYDDPTVPPFPDRVLHPTARLGFHAPSLDVPKGRYGPADVAQGYATALASMALLLRDLDRLAFPISLAAVMLDTPPETFTEITTIGQATRFGIAVAPIKAPAELDPMLANLACSHAQSYALDQEFVYLDEIQETTPDPDGRQAHAQSLLNFGSDGLSGCDLWYWPPLDPRGEEGRYGYLPTTYAGRIEMMTGAPPLTLAMLWPPETPIADLALADDAIRETARAGQVTTHRETSALCVMLDARAALRSSAPCRILEAETWTAAGLHARTRQIVEGETRLLQIEERIDLAQEGGAPRIETLDGAAPLQDWEDAGPGEAYRARVWNALEAAEADFADPITECWPTGAAGALCTIEEL